MITVNIRSEDLQKAIRWTDAHIKQLPYSAAQALNAAVQGSKFIIGSKEKSSLAVLERSAGRYLDRPKAQTAKGWRATIANKRDISSTIKPKDRPWDRTRYLAGNIKGGIRAPKPWEAKIRSLGTLDANAYLVPTGAIKQDRYGNISKANINKLINAGNLLIGTPLGGSRPQGIYRRKGRTLRPLFYATPRTQYKAIFPAEQEISDNIQRHFLRYLKLQTLRNVRREAQRR